jgi:hypothetical protein
MLAAGGGAIGGGTWHNDQRHEGRSSGVPHIAIALVDGVDNGRQSLLWVNHVTVGRGRSPL